MSKSKEQQIDAFPVPTRGRPVTGKALTAAQRKAAQRKRAINEVRQAVEGKISIKDLSLTVLMTELAAVVKFGDTKTATKICTELTRRAKVNDTVKS